MPFFNFIKSSNSRNSASRSTDSTSSASSTASSRQLPPSNVSRPPLPPLSSVENHASSSIARVSPENLQPKRLNGAKITHRDADDQFSQSSSSSSDLSGSHALHHQPRSSTRTGKTAFSDMMYEHNELKSFSFGAAPSSSASSLLIPVDPLYRSRDDVDSEEHSLAPDTTPRPSVVDGQQPHIHPSQQLHGSQTSFSLHTNNFTRDSDVVSTRTFGNSSASASVSSFSRPSASNSRATSRVSGRSSTTPQTSANDLTSDEDEDEGEIGRHPLPPEPVETRPLQQRNTHPDGESMYLSEDESDGYAEEYDNDIEIESVAHESTSETGTFFDYSNPSRESVTPDHNGRRGSLAMPIPGATPYNSYHSRDYEYSVPNGRRPSRSLENLHSFSFEQSSSTQRSDDLGAPTSVPESEGDWRDIRKRSIQMQRDKDLPPTVTVNSSTTAVASPPNPSSNSWNIPATDGFDASWLQPYKNSGVVAFDLSEMTDIVDESSRRLNGHRPSYYASRKTSVASTRRQSTVSSQVDIMHRNINGIWSSPRNNERLQMWKFILEKDKDEGVDKEKGRPSISTIFNTKPSTSADQHTASVAGSSLNFDKNDSKDKDRSHGKSKEKGHKEQWKGMALDSEEFWQNTFLGRFKVLRKNAPSLEPGKAPQQRLNISYIRNSKFTNATNRETADGPSVTIHKHSKAAAFSIGRYYRTKPTPPTASAASTSRAPIGLASKDSIDGNRRKGNMILLGTRRVQKAYTSTNTTRKLESHGLLDDGEHASSKDAERSRKQERERRAKHRYKERKDKKENGDKGKTAESSSKRSTGKTDSKPSKSKEKEKEKTKDNFANSIPVADSSEGSSIGSVAMSSGDSGTLTNSITAVTTPDASYAGSGSSAGGSSVGSIDQSIFSHETTSSDRTARAPESRPSVVRHRAHSRIPHVLGLDMDDDNDDEYDSSEERQRPSIRTSHREAYAALPPEAFDSAHQESTSRGLFGFARSITGDRGGHRANPYMEAAYNPPWPTTQPRHNSETRKYIVDDLNTSFQDVGLLPATGEIRPSSSRGGQPKRRREQQSSKKPTKNQTEVNEIDIFEDVPDDALYMLLPLWPGETDPLSAKKYPYTVPPNHLNSRQYLLLYFKTYPTPPPASHSIQEEGSKTKSSDKKKKGSQDTPASSIDADKNVLLHNFHASARVFSHRDLQGSGVRIPDVGLAVSGPLKDAYDNLPDTCQRTEDIVLATCHSRNMGIEFWPEGFDKIGLTQPMLNPRPLEPNEDDDSSSNEIQAVLTPLGRAVLEMAWLGCLAVTSFNPNLSS